MVKGMGHFRQGARKGVKLQPAWPIFTQAPRASPLEFKNHFLFQGCCGLCCVPCQAGDIASRLGESYPMYFIISCIAPCVPVFLLRSKVRDTFGIEGSTGGDAFAACCCGCCASVQLANELDDRGK